MSCGALKCRERGSMGAVVVLAAALVGAACSGSGSGPITGAAPAESTGAELTRDEVASAIADWECGWLAACCDSSTASVNRASCVEAKQEKQLRYWSTSDYPVLDQDAALQCLEHLRETPPTCEAPSDLIAPCFRVLGGDRPLGTECESKYQCAGQRQGLVGCIDGRCAERQAAGEDCTPSLECDKSGECSLADVCDLCRGDARCRRDEEGSYRCIAFERTVGQEGDPCDPPPILVATGTETLREVTCRVGLFCTEVDSQSGGLECRRPGELGEICSPSRPCDVGLRCEEGRCVAVPVAGLGEACTGIGSCEQGLLCATGSLGRARCTSLTDLWCRLADPWLEDRLMTASRFRRGMRPGR